MTMQSARSTLAAAQSKGYAIPLFDTFEMLGTEGIFQAIEAKGAATIVGMYAHWIEKPQARAFAAYLSARCQDASVPVSLMLDHGGSVANCITALQYGFSDVMFDGSSLPLEENIAQTRQVVEAAHAVGAGVEAELGHVGVGADYRDPDKVKAGYTDPAAAERFVAETGVDFLAIAIGTAHGVYQGTPELDIERLSEIRKRVDIPLVLHGGSGLSDEQFRSAIEAGICKVNVFTDLGLTACRRAVTAAQAPDVSFFSIGEAFTEAFRERCGYYMDLFGASGQGD